jgi:hypothetical protein
MIPNTLDDLVPYWPPETEADQETRQFIGSQSRSEGSPEPAGLALEYQELLPIEEVHSEDEASGESTSSDEESSASSTSSAKLAEPEDIAFIFCTNTKAKLHIALDAEHNEYQSCKTACGRTLRQSAFGLGVHEARSSQREWSPRCFRKLPLDVQRMWQPEE